MITQLIFIFYKLQLTIVVKEIKTEFECIFRFGVTKTNLHFFLTTDLGRLSEIHIFKLKNFGNI